MKRKCMEEKCECMNEEVACTCEEKCNCKKKKVGLLVGIGAGLAAVGAAVTGIFISKKKKEKEEE